VEFAPFGPFILNHQLPATPGVPSVSNNEKLMWPKHNMNGICGDAKNQNKVRLQTAPQRWGPAQHAAGSWWGPRRWAFLGFGGF
jgi:hypothetical protein